MQRPTLVPLTAGNGSGLWPTAPAMDARQSGRNPDTTGTHGTTLTDRAVRMWGAPVAHDDQKSPEAHLAMKARMGGGRTEVTSLTVQAKMWPTPRTTDGTAGNDPQTAGKRPQGTGLDLGTTASLHDPTTTTDGPTGPPTADLNPNFVEALMGLPDNWSDPLASLTDSTYSATDTSRNAPPKPCGNCSTVADGN